MSRSTYWRDCIEAAANDYGLVLTEEQIGQMAGAVEGCHENYSMAHGYDRIRNPTVSKAEDEVRRLRKQIDDREKWERTTNPCRSCYTNGMVLDGWGRDQKCMRCDGTGRVDRGY